MRLSSTIRGVVLLGMALGTANLVLAPVAGQQPPAEKPSAGGTLKGELSTLARQIAGYIAGVNRAELEVKPYRCSPQLHASAGPGIQKLLIDELDKLGIKNKPGAACTCEGEYTFLSRQQKVVIETKILENGAPKFVLRPVPSLVSEVEDVLALAGGTGTVAVGNPEQAKKDIVSAVETPAVKIETGANSRASARAGGPFAIELCRIDKQAGQVLGIPLEEVGGQAYVRQDAALKVGENYGIRVYNGQSFPVAVTVTIDGLNMFVLSEIPQFRQLGKLIIPPGKDHLIQGWHVRNELAHAFQVAQLPEALVVRLSGPGPLRNPEAVGTITVSFRAAAIGPETTLPPDEPDIRSLATAEGAPVETNYRSVQVSIGRVREVVSIRYSSPTDLPQ